MHVSIRTAAVAAVCSLCVATGVDARTVRPSPAVMPTATTYSVTTRAVSLTSFSDLLAAATPQGGAEPQSESAAGGVLSSTDLIGAVAQLLATSKTAPTSPIPEVNTAVADPAGQPTVDDPPVNQPAADDPAPPTNFPGPRPAFGTPSYFAQLAFAVFHVVALPIAVPVQFFLGSAEGVPTVIAAAINDLSGLLGQIPGLSTQQPSGAQAQQNVAEVSSPLQKLSTAAADPTAAVDPPADPLPTNFPGPRPAFGTPSYFAQLAFAVLHVVALPITVPVQAIIGNPNGVPSVIVAALNDLTSLLGQAPKLSAPQTAQTPSEASLASPSTQANTKQDAASEKTEAVKKDADPKTSKTERAEHEGKSAETPKTEHEVKPVEKPAESTKTDPPKAVEPKAEPAKAVEPKADPVASEPVKPEIAKPEIAKPATVKPATVKPETAKPPTPDTTHPVKVIRDSLKSTPGETSTTGGAKAAEGSKGAETESKTPDASTSAKVREGLKSTEGAKTDKPAEKPPTGKPSTEKSASSSEGNSHSSEGKTHTSEGKSHSSSTD
ncbi:hypothetical protein FZI91_23235 [Mycobacterium sp. CBMA271]|uniref:hypothetical protein n=1 Tax=unclassified Mycobacteroides TaxID=2618759 RepID=UPI0012DFCC77|nr:MULTISPECIES: hypothetical protein [unclassified Mycobacteroides]MUM18561.1 hypothetical protein [Mycobacteroides sp. CBMA 326]MUM24593.1 hypothetical protein [Mycobacteroides sp. CBMA 271]